MAFDPLLIAGCLLVILALLAVIRNYHLRKTRITTTAKVVALKRVYYGFSGDPVFLPLLEFTDKDNNIWQVQRNIGGIRTPYFVGEMVPIYYNPKKPTRLFIFNPLKIALVITLFISIGAILIFAALNV